MVIAGFAFHGCLRYRGRLGLSGGAMIDVQSSGITSRFGIESVGITGLKYPLLVRDSVSGEQQATIAHWKLGVDLPGSRRGTHMSRFITALDNIGGVPLDLDGHYQFATSIATLLDAESAQIQAEFLWFRRIAAPISGHSAQLESTVVFSAVTGPKAKKTLTVRVAAKSLCPCSKAVSDRGAHNQRSDLTLRVHLDPGQSAPAINHLLEILEGSASSPVYPVLKREDEKYVTEYAYDHPVFVEDIVRLAAEKVSVLAQSNQISGFEVEAINRESIHAHDCFAKIVFP